MWDSGVCLSLSDPTSSHKSRPKHPLWSSHCVPQEDRQTEWQDLISLQQGGLYSRRHIYHAQGFKTHLQQRTSAHNGVKFFFKCFPSDICNWWAEQHFSQIFPRYFNCTESSHLWMHTRAHTRNFFFFFFQRCNKKRWMHMCLTETFTCRSHALKAYCETFENYSFFNRKK